MVEVFFGAADSMEERMGLGWCGRILGSWLPSYGGLILVGVAAQGGEFSHRKFTSKKHSLKLTAKAPENGLFAPKGMFINGASC